MTETASLRIRVDSSGVAKGSKELDRLSASGAKAEQSTSRLTRNFVALGVAVAGVAVGAFARRVISATREQEAAVAQLRQGIESTGGAAGKSLDDLTAKAAEFQRVTTFGDEAIIRAQAVLLTFTNVAGDAFDQATEAALNMSARMGTDLNSAILQVGKSLNDPIQGVTALTRAGVQFTDAQKEQIRILVESGRQADAQRIILKELETQFGGSARAARDTFGGAIEGLTNAYGDLFEASKNLDGAKDAIEELTAVLQDPRTREALQTITGLVISWASASVKAAVNTVNFLDEISRAADAIRSGFAQADVMGFNAEIERLTALREREAERDTENSRLAVAWLDQRIEKLRGQSDATQELVDLLGDQAVAEENITRAQVGRPQPSAVVDPAVLRAQAEALAAADAFAASETDDFAQSIARAFSEAQGVFASTRTEVEQLAAQIQRVSEMEESFFTLQGIDREDILKRLNDQLTALGENQAAIQVADQIRSNIGGAIDDIFTSGELSASNFFNSVLRDLARVATQLIVMRPLMDALFGASGTEPGGALGGLIGGLMGVPAAATGGSFKVGGSGGTDTKLVSMRLTPGELVEVTPAGRKAGGSGTIVNVIDQRGGNAAPVEMSRSSSGGMEVITAIIRGEVGAMFADGAMDRQFRASSMSVRRLGNR